MFDVRAFRLTEDSEVGVYPRAAVRWPPNGPVPVLVDLTRMIPAVPRWGLQVPIWVRRRGLPMRPAAGLLHAWVLSQTGVWCGVCELDLHSEDGLLQLAVPAQLVPAAALRAAPVAQ